jgi:hypothetical protein
LAISNGEEPGICRKRPKRRSDGCYTAKKTGAYQGNFVPESIICHAIMVGGDKDTVPARLVLVRKHFIERYIFSEVVQLLLPPYRSFPLRLRNSYIFIILANIL